MIDWGCTSVEDVLPEADLTVVCIPPEPTIAFVEAHAGCWRRGAIVTDIGSTKEQIVRSCRNRLRPLGVHFVGSHPMAGSEQSGLTHADPDLYQDAVVFVADVPGDPAQAVDAVVGLWRSVGGTPHMIEPDEHDRLTSRTSHILHLLAGVAAHACLGWEDEAVLGGAGALRDMTRIAGSSPDMWLQIVRQNDRNVLERLAEVSGELDRIREMIEGQDWPGLSAYLAEARDNRSHWLARRNARRQPGRT